MERERFEAMIAAYGAEPARWPAAERADGLAFLARHADAAEMLQAETALDDVLDAWTPAPVNLAVGARILAAAPTPRSPAPVWRRRGLWLSGAGLAAACAAGVLFGVNAGSAGIAVGSADSDAANVLASGLDLDLTS